MPPRTFIFKTENQSLKFTCKQTRDTLSLCLTAKWKVPACLKWNEHLQEILSFWIKSTSSCYFHPKWKDLFLLIFWWTQISLTEEPENIKRSRAGPSNPSGKVAIIILCTKNFLKGKNREKDGFGYPRREKLGFSAHRCDHGTGHVVGETSMKKIQAFWRLAVKLRT